MLLNILHCENLEVIIRAMFTLSEEVDDLLGADMSVPVGVSPEEGEKPDVINVWNTSEKAIEGLKNMGFTDEEIGIDTDGNITGEGILKKGTTEDAFKGSSVEDLQQFYEENIALEGGDGTVFYCGIGLKHYEDGFSTMHAGTRQHGSLGETMKNPESQMWQKAADHFGYDDNSAGAGASYFEGNLNAIFNGFREAARKV